MLGLLCGEGRRKERERVRENINRTKSDLSEDSLWWVTGNKFDISLEQQQSSPSALHSFPPIRKTPSAIDGRTVTTLTLMDLTTVDRRRHQWQLCKQHEQEQHCVRRQRRSFSMDQGEVLESNFLPVSSNFLIRLVRQIEHRDVDRKKNNLGRDAHGICPSTNIRHNRIRTVRRHVFGWAYHRLDFLFFTGECFL